MKIITENGPFMKSKNSTTKMMMNLLIALTPIILFSFYYNGIRLYNLKAISLIEMFKPLLLVLVGTLTSFLIEVIYALIIKNKKPFEYSFYSYSIFPGLFLSLIVPVNTPIILLIMAVCFGVIFGKIVFGGFGKNIFNPSLVGYLFIFVCYSSTLTSSLDAISGATPLANLKGFEYVGTYNDLVLPYNSIFDLILGFKGGAIGEISGLLCIIAFIYLTITKVIKYKIPCTYILTVFIMASIIALTNDMGLWYPLLHIFSGGLLFGAVFMATDPVTTPITSFGQIVSGILMGIITVICRFLIPGLVEGVMLSILSVNLLVAILDNIGVKVKFDIKKCIIPLVILILLVITLSLYIGLSKVKTDKKDTTSLEIIETIKNNDKTTYTLYSKGYSGKIKLKVIFNKDNINSIEVLEHQESEFIPKVISEGLIDNLVSTNGDISKVDSVSGATFTSKYLKETISELTKYHKGA